MFVCFKGFSTPQISKEYIYRASDRIPVTLSNEKFLQAHVKYPEAEKFVKNHHSDLKDFVGNIQVQQDKTHEINNGDATMIEKMVLVKSSKMDVVGKLHTNHKVAFQITNKDEQFAASLRGGEYTELRYVALKVERGMSGVYVSLVPAYQIMATQQASSGGETITGRCNVDGLKPIIDNDDEISNQESKSDQERSQSDPVDVRPGEEPDDEPVHDKKAERQERERQKKLKKLVDEDE